MISTLIARFMGPTWGPTGADRTQIGPMFATWPLLSGDPFVDITQKVVWSAWVQHPRQDVYTALLYFMPMKLPRRFLLDRCNQFTHVLLGSHLWQGAITKLSPYPSVKELWDMILYGVGRWTWSVHWQHGKCKLWAICFMGWGMVSNAASLHPRDSFRHPQQWPAC